MSEEHIPIPEGWLDPQFRGGEPPPLVSGQLPDVGLPPRAPGVPGAGGGRPAGVAGMVHAGGMAAPILAPVTSPGNHLVAGNGGGSSLYRKPIGSSPDGPLIHASDAWMSSLNTGVGGPGLLAGQEWNPEDELEWPEEEPPGPVIDPLFPRNPPVREPTLPPTGLPEVPEEPVYSPYPGAIPRPPPSGKEWWWGGPPDWWPPEFVWPPWGWWRRYYLPPPGWDPSWPWPPPEGYIPPFDPFNPPWGLDDPPPWWPEREPYPHTSKPEAPAPPEPPGPPPPEEEILDREGRLLAALDKWIQVAERARDWWLDRVVEHYWAHSDVASNPDPDPQVQAAKLREAKKYLEDATRKYENYIKKIEKLEKKKKRVKEQAERRRAERRRYQ